MKRFRVGIERARRRVRKQGLWPTLTLGMQVVRGAWQLRQATNRGRMRVNGKLYVRNEGYLWIGDRVRMDSTTVPIELVCFRGAELEIGDGTYINYGTNISATERVAIGRECAIGQYCIIMDNDYHQVGDLWGRPKPAPVSIGDKVWLGARVIVLPGSTIGPGSVIGANSVVKGTIPAGVVAAGMPARVIRTVHGEASG